MGRIRVLEFSSFINRFDFIDSIVQFADPRRFEVSVCVRSEEHNIAAPTFPEGTKYALIPGNSRKDILPSAYRLARLLKEWDIDILHAHHFEQAVIGWLATKINRRTKLIIGRHYSDAIYRNENALKRRALLLIEGWVNGGAQRIIVPSRMIFDILSVRQGVDPAKIDLIHYGFVPDKYALPTAREIDALRNEFGMAGKFVIANIGRYHEEKGHRYLIDAAAKLRESVPNLLVLCIGDGPERRELEDQISRERLNGTVRLVGWRQDAITFMAAADAIVQSSLQEAFSQVMIEAMWMAKPLIITDISGAADVLKDRDNGILVPKSNAEALASAITRLSEDKELQQRLGHNGRHFVQESLGIEKQILEYEASFVRAASAK